MGNKRSLLKIALLVCILLSLSSLTAQKTDSIKSGVYAWNKLQPKKEKSSISRQILKGETLDLAYFEIHASTL
ncbi:MAG TPA: hypothetical protein VNS50_05845, partial [Ginsengibacter sp.]|nr:hypothetical protein [Ginsengibacter sp.]